MHNKTESKIAGTLVFSTDYGPLETHLQVNDLDKSLVDEVKDWLQTYFPYIRVNEVAFIYELENISQKINLTDKL